MSTDDALDREFAYIDYRSSCRNLHTLDQLCRRPAGHKGEHASGFGSTRARWANDDEQEGDAMSTPNDRHRLSEAGGVLLRQGPLSGRWFALTKWHREGANIVADEKHDVTGEVERILAARAQADPERAPVGETREQRAWDEGVQQAMTWLRADYEYGTGPDWREDGAEWIADRLAEHNADRIEAKP